MNGQKNFLTLIKEKLRVGQKEMVSDMVELVCISYPELIVLISVFRNVK